MKRASFLTVCALIVTAAVALAVEGAVQRGQASPVVVEVYKDPSCGCCALWVKHLEAAGFTAKITEMPNAKLAEFKTSHGIPQAARSCHTGVVGGYVLEGHVPAAEVQKLLKDKPAVVGLAVPGMPIGSPGMEVNGMKPAAYDVVSFDKQGATKVFASYNK